MEVLMPFVISLLAGAIGGNVAGALLRKFSLGVMGNSLAGIVGGGLGGQFLGIVGARGIEGILGQVVFGGAGGGVLMIAIGLIRKFVAR